MAMTGAVLTRWYKEPGETVAAGEAIAEIETDKSAVDLESPADGVLGPHLAAEGDEVPIGAAVTRILDRAEELVPAAAPDHHVAPGSAPLPASQVSPPGPTSAPPQVSPPEQAYPPPPQASARAPHALSPRKRMAARLAAEAA